MGKAKEKEVVVQHKQEINEGQRKSIFYFGEIAEAKRGREIISIMASGAAVEFQDEPTEIITNEEVSSRMKFLYETDRELNYRVVLGNVYYLIVKGRNGKRYRFNLCCQDIVELLSKIVDNFDLYYDGALRHGDVLEENPSFELIVG